MPGESQSAFKALSLQLIDENDRTFLASRSGLKVSPSLNSWIQAVGILVPLRVNLREDGAYRIVSGFRRFSAACQLGMKEVPCLVDQDPPPKLFLKAVVENLATRGCDELEKATIIHKMGSDFQKNDEELIGKVLPLLGIQGNRYRLEYYRRLAHLTESLQQAVSEGVLVPEVALKVSGWDSEEASLFVRTISEYRLGRNKQRHLFELADELKASMSADLGVVWERSGAAEIDRDQKIPPEVRYGRIREALVRLRYPVLSGHQERFRRLKGALRLPGTVQLAAPKYFEGDSIEVSFRTRNSEEFVHVAEHLSRAARCDELKEIFELL
jgi:ParB/RepB/Spo0J family partition protein